MDRERKIRLFAHPLFIAAVLSLIAVPFFIRLFPEFKATITGTVFPGRQDGLALWADFNGDGESEKLDWFSNSEGKATWKITGQDGFLKDLQLFDGEALILRNPPVITELDFDAFPEVATFYHRNDSLFFRIVEYSNDFAFRSGEEIFVTIVENSVGTNDYDVSFSKNYDFDGDSIREFLFGIMAGYPVIPRNLYSFNTVTHHVRSSKFLGGNTAVRDISDLDSDGKPELLLGQYAPGNMHGAQIEGYDDQSVRLIVLNDTLGVEFDPPVWGTEYSSLVAMPVRKGPEVYIAALLGNAKSPEENSHLMLYTPAGELIIKKAIQDGVKRLFFFDQGIPSGEGLIPVFDSEGYVSFYDLRLQQVDRKKLPWKEGLLVALDIDKDGQLENINYEPSSNRLFITRERLKKSVSLEMPYDINPVGRVNLKENRGKPNEILLQSQGKYCLVSYGRNPMYPYRVLLVIAFYGFLAGFIFLIQYLQRLVSREKYMAERKVSELQLLLIRNQITPHFLFNAMNSISYRLMKKDPDEANNSMVRLSRLIRNNLVAMDRLSRSLEDELDAVKSYVEIVRSQLEEPFDFLVEISPETDSDVQVPVMVIQNYVENSAKHGISTLGAQGRIILSVSQDARYLHIRLTDNGIGRQRSRENTDNSKSTGKGVGLMEQFFTEVNKYNVNKISASITDLYSADGLPAGTEVAIDIPVDMRYRIYGR